MILLSLKKDTRVTKNRVQPHVNFTRNSIKMDVHILSSMLVKRESSNQDEMRIWNGGGGMNLTERYAFFVKSGSKLT